MSLLTSHLFLQADWTNHTDQVVSQAYLCQQLIVDMETGLRGFEATKDRRFLEPYNAANLRIEKEFDLLSVLVRDNESQTQRVGEVQSKFAEWKSFATNMLSITAGNLSQPTPANIRGKVLMDSIRSAFSDFVEGEKHLRQSRSEAVERLKKNFLLARIGLGIPIAVALGWFLRKKLFQMATEYNLIVSSVQAQKELLQVTLNSIGDAVITTDVEGKVTALNPVAASLTGWTISEAIDLPLEHVFNIVNEQTRKPAENPVKRVLKEGKIIGLANHTALISKAGNEVSIEDSAAPIKDPSGHILGAVMVFHDVTDQRKGERKLIESESRKSAILAASLDAIVTMDHKGKVVDFNPSAERIFGYPQERAIGSFMAELIIPDRFRKRHVEGLANYLASGEGPVLGKRLELPAVCADGREITVELTIIPIGGMIPPMFTSTLRDITERKAAEEALRQQREWFKVTLASIGDAVITTDVEGKITFINTVAQTLTGWSADEALGMQIEKVFKIQNEVTLDASENPVTKVLRERKIVALANHTALISKDNRTVSIEDSAAPILDDEGKIIGVVMVFHDASEQRRVEKVQLEASEKLHFMAESMPQKILTLKASGEVDYFNRQWTEFTGQKMQSAESWNWTPFVHPDDLDKTNPQWNESIKTGNPFQIEHRFKRHDGQYRWHLTQARAMNRNGNRITNWIVSSTDIDDQKRSEENLEVIVNQRTLELRETIAHLEEFSYSVAHDLRAPLRAMQGYANAVLEDYHDRLDEEGRDFLRRIVSAGLRMDRLTLDVLTFTKVARTSIVCQPVDLNRIVDDIIQQHSQLQPPSAEIIVERPLLSVVAHDPSLGQAISNLLNNAVKFVAQGVKPRVKVRSELRGDQVRLWVEDNGIGIKPEHQNRLFGMFERLDFNQQYEGTGIGLAIVRKSVEKMGGSSGMESDGINGSKFWIQLPTPKEP